MAKPRKLKFLPLNRLFPNMVTILSLCAGLSAIRFALVDKWELAVTFILVAAVLDGVDGRLARLLNATSTFGAHLDSLTDFVNFGVTPAIILYLWQVDNITVRGLGWGICLFYIICMAIRLARFNSALEDADRPKWADAFFTGVPAPAGAGLALLPMIISFKIGDEWIISPEYVAGHMVVVALLLVSRIPTFSAKKLRVRHDLASLAMVLGAVLVIALLMEPWIAFPVIGALYLLSIPFSIAYYRKIKRGEVAPPVADEETGDEA